MDEKKTYTPEEIKAALTMEDKEIGKLAMAARDAMDLEDTTDFIIRTLDGTQGHSLIEKLLLLSIEAYGLGYAAALYGVNEGIKDFLAGA